MDDDHVWLAAVRRAFSENPQVIFAECHSVDEAMKAIDEQKPDVIFLDHILTDRGNEGFEIVERVGTTKVYSTTGNNGVAKIYAERGIEHVGKMDLGKLRSIVAEC